MLGQDDEAAALTLDEWSSVVVESSPPTDNDLKLAEHLRSEEDRRLDVVWLHGGRMQITTTSWVGVVRIGGQSIRIVPKYAGRELGVLRMLAFTQGLARIRRLPNEEDLPTGGTYLLELLCQLLAEEVDRLLVAGLIRDYVEEDADLTVLRGSIRHREQATRHFGRLDRLACRFDDYHGDIPENRLLVTALSVASRLPISVAVRKRLRRLEGALRLVANEGPTEPDAYTPHLSYDRRTQHYEPAHRLCLLLLQAIALKELYSSGDQRIFSFLLDMNQLFEDVVSRLVSDAFAGTGLVVESQRRFRSVIRNDLTGKPYSSIVPDLLVRPDDRSDRRRLPLDVKYKRYDLKKVSTSDIYQTFLYAYALTDRAQDAHAGILYPSLTPSSTPQLSILGSDEQVGARVSGVGLHLPSILDSVEQGGDAYAETLSNLRHAIRPLLDAAA